ncbi:MAG: tRNA epoxyqueuosine(34) reductase QueG [Rhodospirillales bacterium]|nr:tRNA epoxyqueuosine(34) reductase QueG [Rhodospirillales bacterium]
MTGEQHPRTPSAIKDAIRAKAKESGFDAVGFAAADENPADRAALARFLKLGRHGDMDWMATTEARRGAPGTLWPAARTVIALGLSYAPGRDPLAALARRDRGTISVYAQGRDYHGVLKTRLKKLARWIADAETCEVKVFVDTAPVMEKPLAARAGIGWQGKHTNLLSREFGSWLFLGEVFTTLALPPDAPEPDHCGSCDRCREACPTDALPEPYRIDPTRCISYLTIEHKGAIQPELMAKMGNRVYGCDDCLAVCPWNKFAPPSREDVFFPRAELAAPRLADLAALDDAGFRNVFSGSPIKRTGRDRFVRNVLIAIGNSGDPALAESARKLQDDPAPVVRDAARWALRRLG